MADQVDVASEMDDVLMSAALSFRPRFTGVSATHCAECGDKIPEGRRAALPGVQLCVECAK